MQQISGKPTRGEVRNDGIRRLKPAEKSIIGEIEQRRFKTVRPGKEKLVVEK